MWQMPERRRLGTGENITRSGLTAHWDMRRRTSSVLPVINGEQLIVLMYVDKLVFSLLLRTPISSGPRNGEQPSSGAGTARVPVTLAAKNGALLSYGIEPAADSGLAQREVHHMCVGERRLLL